MSPLCPQLWLLHKPYSLCKRCKERSRNLVDPKPPQSQYHSAREPNVYTRTRNPIPVLTIVRGCTCPRYLACMSHSLSRNNKSPSISRVLAPSKVHWSAHRHSFRSVAGCDCSLVSLVSFKLHLEPPRSITREITYPWVYRHV